MIAVTAPTQKLRMQPSSAQSLPLLVHRVIGVAETQPNTDTIRELWNVWFQHDDAPIHKISSVKQYLVEELEEQIIEYFGFQESHPRSTDRTPMNFYLWGYLKQQVYATPPPKLQDL
ncbi:hypothetical protein AVEN_159777-1 [Araneus ventricosus]|uniref:Uncharacterized protein n=1 Tax=Araneus ventricosus TaxID=182803 RepID=A0A4Y2DBE7_ARAVE|nr:hypothetical protein AVEN_159777-1 [Araneus ventricosus]